MDKQFYGYFTTGEFANLFRIKKQTLFHYDEIGLFSPEVRKENGYRYYSHTQFELFQVISLFKEVGVPLKEIKFLLNDKTSDNIITLFKGKSIEIGEKIKKLEHLKTIMETKVKLAEQAIEADLSSVSIQYLEEERIMITPNLLGLSEWPYITVISDLIHYVQSHELNLGHPVSGMLAKEQILEKDFYNYQHLFFKIPNNVENLDYHVKPKGLYAVGYQKGNEVEAAYDRIIQFIEKSGLKIGEYAYEEYILDEVMVDGMANQITKIQLQVLRELD
ncbi:BltR family transcriptional regulator [Paenibacillus kribbensis]|uniref:BltR family transcriptional regulator n=1 Tax=Paenibacillus kribbensis TaxID=172713 RepID=A0A222WNQ2_9BACL|nr:MerR family transcriptional regulator [Paenibacillus kribbensis]ASR47433.1 BltR family transcriptional regulator [Paenibacillus kribbensis]